MNPGTGRFAGGAGSDGPDGAATFGGCSAAAGLAAGAAGLAAAAAGAAGFAAGAAGATGLGAAGAAADTPAPGTSVLETSAFSGSDGMSLAGLSPAAMGGPGGAGASGGLLDS